MSKIYGATLTVAGQILNVTTAIKLFTMDEHKAVLQVKYITNATPAEEHWGVKGVNLSSHRSRALTPSAV